MKTMLRLFFRAFFLSFFLAGSVPMDAIPRWDLILTESEWLAPNIIRVPFTLTGTLITVRARIDTLEGNFFFDTGSSSLLLNARYFGNRAQMASIGGGGVTGKVRMLGSSKADTFRLDNLTMVELKAGLADLSHLENAKKIALIGLIGCDVFKDYEVLFDYASSLLILVRTDSKGRHSVCVYQLRVSAGYDQKRLRVVLFPGRRGRIRVRPALV